MTGLRCCRMWEVQRLQHLPFAVQQGGASIVAASPHHAAPQPPPAVQQGGAARQQPPPPTCPPPADLLAKAEHDEAMLAQLRVLSVESSIAHWRRTAARTSFVFQHIVG